jgi:hypothetical protein
MLPSGHAGALVGTIPKIHCPMHCPARFSIPLLLISLAMPFAGPVGCGRSVTNSELQVEESKRDELELKAQKMEVEIKALNAEVKELNPKYGGPDPHE